MIVRRVIWRAVLPSQEDRASRSRPVTGVVVRPALPVRATMRRPWDNGTTCLVWSSPRPAFGQRPIFHVDLMGGQKPHLLTSVKNNLAAETRIGYAPSTRFYLDDRMAGRPWVTRLTFPVQVVERVDVFDWIAGRSRAMPTTTVISTGTSANSAASAWWNDGTPKSSEPTPPSPTVTCRTGTRRRGRRRS